MDRQIHWKKQQTWQNLKNCKFPRTIKTTLELRAKEPQQNKSRERSDLKATLKQITKKERLPNTEKGEPKTGDTFTQTDFDGYHKAQNRKTS